MSDYPIPGVDMTPEQRLEWWERVAFIEGAKREQLEGCIATIRYLHAPRDSRLVDEDGIEHLVNVRDFFPGLFPATRTAPAAEPLDVERLTKAMDFDRVEALSIIEKHGFVFATDLSKPIESRTDAERWEALAFTLYTMLLPSNRRSERIADEYARLRSPESD